MLTILQGRELLCSKFLRFRNPLSFFESIDLHTYHIHISKRMFIAVYKVYEDYSFFLDLGNRYQYV